MSKEVKGYEPGKATSFIPTKSGDWIDPFNNLLDELNRNGQKYSRNKLTEMLLEAGIKAYMSEGAPNQSSKNLGGLESLTQKVPLKWDHYSSEQMVIIEKPEFQQMIHMFIQQMFTFWESTGRQFNVASPNQPLPNSFVESESTEKPIENITYVETEKIVTEQEVSPTIEKEPSPEEGKKMSPGALKALQRLKQQKSGL